MLETVRAIDDYLDKAGVSSQTTHRDTLIKVVKSFSRLPYENITKIIKAARSENLEAARRLPEEVLSDHFSFLTGGTCFSLTNTLRDILRECDFQPEIAMADMKAGDNIHCALLLREDDHVLLIDPGYLVDRPVILNPMQPVMIKTPMNDLSIEPENEGNSYSVYVIRKGIKKWRYRLHTGITDEKTFMSHWDRSFSMNMMNSITLSRVHDSAQIYFSRSRFHLVEREKRKSQNVRGAESACISQWFDIEPGLVEQAMSILDEKRQKL